MEKKTVFYPHIRITGPVATGSLKDHVNGGPQELGHNKKQQEALANGRHFLKIPSDRSKLFYPTGYTFQLNMARFIFRCVLFQAPVWCVIIATPYRLNKCL